MKKLILFLSIFQFLQAAQGQTKFGLSGGISLDKIHISDSVWEDLALNHIGYSFGITSKFELNSKLNLNPSISYSQRGVRFDNSSINLSATKWNLNYLTADVLLEIKTYKNLSLEIGPQWGYMLSANQIIPSNSGDISDGFKKNDLLGILGISYNVNKNLYLSLRYSYGLIDINNISFVNLNSPEEYYYPKEYNRSLSLSVNYYLLIKDKSNNSKEKN